MASVAAYDPKHALNAVCPYFTMFPLEFPFKALSRTPNAKVIADPFCGRGTSLYAARATNRQAFGIDCSPVAVAISKAKLASSNLESVLSLAEELLELEPTSVPEGEFWMHAYHPDVLRGICSLREGLLRRRSDHAAVLRAVVMGILHGPVTGVGSYLSNQMQRTFAPKPAYAVRYWTRKSLVPPQIDILSAIRRKAKAVFVSSAFEFQDVRTTNVIFGDSANGKSWKNAPSSIDTVITSPPYYGMRTYVPDQWLRNWFVGGPSVVDYSDDGRLPSASPQDFAKGLAEVWNNIGNRAGSDLHVFVRFGVLPSRKVDAKSILFSSFEESKFNWQKVYTQSASNASSGRRQAAQMKGADKAENEFDAHLRLI